ncbi:MAG: alpha/beta hydrolase [Myxococcota bacterium]
MATSVTFSGALGKPLSGMLEQPVGPARASALFAHCFTCSKDLRAARRITAALAAAGLAALRFDFTGLGESEGDFSETDVSSNVDDVVAAADYMRDALGRAPSLLVGHSLGGAAALLACARIPECTAVATIGTPADTEHVRHLFGSAEDEITRCGEADVVLAGRTFRIKAQFLDDLAEHALLRQVRELDRALLVLHAPDDDIVAVDNARMLFQAARHPKSFVSLGRADHLLSRPADASYAGEVIAVWSQPYLPA